MTDACTAGSHPPFQRGKAVQLTLPYKNLAVVITNESPYDARSADNVSSPDAETFLGETNYRASSRHLVAITDGTTVVASRMLLANGGATGVHAHSAIVRDDTCFVAVGPFVCALALPSLEVFWSTQADQATCFGLYESTTYASLISHGELEIARLAYSGEIIWSSGGRDIFTEGFELHDHTAEAVDFAGTRYRIDLATGRSEIVTG